MSEPTAVRIVIADDHAIVRDGLHRLLESNPRYAVVAEAASGREAILLVRSHRPDLLLLDVSMPEISGLDVLKSITPDVPETKAIVLTASLDRSVLLEAVEHGARGVVEKTTGSDVLFAAIATVLDGRYSIEGDSFTDLASVMRELSGTLTATRHPFGLTDRQLQIVERVVRSMTNRQIAASLSISEETVKHHLTQIFNKTGVSSRLELALLATERRLVDMVHRVR
jgi:two-component system, NarL family, nitrate/nitrite response regulator NarL